MEKAIKFLKNYIENNLKDEDGGNWEYIYRPEIRDLISDLNQQESEILSVEMLSWDEEIQFVLADEIADSENKYLDKCYLYCAVLSKTTDRENGEYLLENFMAIFNGLDSSKHPVDFLEKLREKVIEFSKAEIDESHIFHKKYTEKLKDAY